jgi:hypothetical protein
MMHLLLYCERKKDMGIGVKRERKRDRERERERERDRETERQRDRDGDYLTDLFVNKSANFTKKTRMLNKAHSYYSLTHFP